MGILNVYSFSLGKHKSTMVDVFSWSDECLVSAGLHIKFADDLPVILDEELMTKQLIDLVQPVPVKAMSGAMSIVVGVIDAGYVLAAIDPDEKHVAGI